MPKTPTWLVDETVSADLLERVLTVEYLTTSLQTAQEELTASHEHVGGRIVQVEEEVREQKQRLGRLLTVIEQKGMNDLIEPQYDRANERYLALTAELAGLRAAQAHTQPQTLQPEEIERYVGEMRAILTDGPIQERQALMRQFINRVVLHLDRVTIEYKFRPEFDAKGGSFTRFLGSDGNRGLRIAPSWGHHYYRKLAPKALYKRLPLARLVLQSPSSA